MYVRNGAVFLTSYNGYGAELKRGGQSCSSSLKA